MIASHNGYRNLKTNHQREWNFSDHRIEITDTLTGKITEGKAHFWLSPQHATRTKRQSDNGLTMQHLNLKMLTLYDCFQRRFLTDITGLRIAYKIEIAFKKN